MQEKIDNKIMIFFCRIIIVTWDEYKIYQSIKAYIQSIKKSVKQKNEKQLSLPSEREMKRKEKKKDFNKRERKERKLSCLSLLVTINKLDFPH